MRSRTFALILAACGLGACAPVMIGDTVPTRASGERSAAAVIGCAVPPDATALQGAMLSTVNARRRAAGLAPLRPSPTLQRAAAQVACDNAQRGRMSHVTRQGIDLRGRLRSHGYGYRMAAEALGHGYRAPARLEAAWAGSAYHRPTLMSPRASDAGIAVALDASGSPWWAMVSARPR